MVWFTEAVYRLATQLVTIKNGSLWLPFFKTQYLKLVVNLDINQDRSLGYLT